MFAHDNNCGLGQGRDICHKLPGGAPLVVRPVILPKITRDLFNSKPRIVCKEIPGFAPLKPIPSGDLCSCRKTVVTPAFVPKPACASCQTNSNPSIGKILSSSSSSSCASSHTSSQAHSQSYVNDFHIKDDETDYKPADPVSLSLAYSQQNKGCNVAEDRLNFGFKKLPKEEKIERKRIKVAEENLFKMNGEVVELKPVKCSGKTLAEEAAEDLIEEELINDEIEEAPTRKISYGELGFGPADSKYNL